MWLQKVWAWYGGADLIWGKAVWLLFRHLSF
jgi:hypothetical protein